MLAPILDSGDNSLFTRHIKSTNPVNSLSIRNTHITGFVILCCILLVISGCSTIKKLNPFSKDDDDAAAPSTPVATGEFNGRGPVALETNPPGATVVTLGRMLGKTPLRVEEQDIFPLIYPREMEPIYGKVRFKLKGCKQVSRRMTPEDIAAGVKIDLECGDAATKQAAAPSQGGSFDSSIDTPLYSGSNNVKVRLLRVKNLLEEGLITQSEADEIRKRILADPSL